jgi:hypothetical protein
MLLAAGSFYNPTVAAENGIEITVVSPSTVLRPAPETAPGGTVVLRGSPVNLNTSLPAPERSGRGYRLTNRPAAVLPPGEGWDTTGIDRNYDIVGFDRSGLSHP